MKCIKMRILGFVELLFLFYGSYAINYPHGLGGASLELICQPRSISKNSEINIQVLYQVDANRPVDLHFDVLQNKVWLAGTQRSLYDNNGTLSINLTLPTHFDDSNLLWKVFLTPLGDRFPNMLAETGLAPMVLSDTVDHQCPYAPLQSSKVIRKDIDSVIINQIVVHPPDPLSITYSLISYPNALLNINFMSESTNLLVVPVTTEIVEKGYNKTVTIHLLPIEDTTDLYLDVSLVPIGLTWFDRLAEDRTYQIK